MRRLLAAACLCLAWVQPANAGTSESLGTGVAIALPVIAGGITLAKDDWKGTAQLTVDTIATVGVAYGLKHVIREQRPDKSDFQSMPSDTSALAFAPAQFLWDRYGWRYGVPAYAAATFVAWSRVDAQKHHWYDVGQRRSGFWRQQNLHHPLSGAGIALWHHAHRWRRLCRAGLQILNRSSGERSVAKRRTASPCDHQTGTATSENLFTR